MNYGVVFWANGAFAKSIIIIIIFLLQKQVRQTVSGEPVFGTL